MSAPEPGLEDKGPYVSEIPWQDTPPDCLIVCCSDHRFERQTRELAAHLNFKNPHVLQVPSGAVLSLPLASAINFLSKAIDRIIERIVETKQVRDIVLVGHHDCGAYKAERIPLLSDLIKRYTKKPIHEIQRDHLADAARRLQLSVRGVRVRAFFADVMQEGPQSHVRFTEVRTR
jgi:carbonic anhydrase